MEKMQKFITNDIVFIDMESDSSMPLFCPVCDFIMKGPIDETYYRKRSCCESCGLKWADVYRDKWLEGWRPPKKEILKEIKKRKKRITC